MNCKHFQHLCQVQKKYDLIPLEESDVEIGVRNFDPQKTRVTLKMFPARIEKNNWSPIYEDDDWNTADKCYVKASI